MHRMYNFMHKRLNTNWVFGEDFQSNVLHWFQLNQVVWDLLLFYYLYFESIHNRIFTKRLKNYNNLHEWTQSTCAFRAT